MLRYDIDMMNKFCDFLLKQVCVLILLFANSIFVITAHSIIWYCSTCLHAKWLRLRRLPMVRVFIVGHLIKKSPHIGFGTRKPSRSAITMKKWRVRRQARPGHRFFRKKRTALSVWRKTWMQPTVALNLPKKLPKREQRELFCYTHVHLLLKWAAFIQFSYWDNNFVQKNFCILYIIEIRSWLYYLIGEWIYFWTTEQQCSLLQCMQFFIFSIHFFTLIPVAMINLVVLWPSNFHVIDTISKFRSMWRLLDYS